jgi:hypothetical protein
VPNFNLVLAVIWFLVSIAILTLPETPPDSMIQLTPETRPWAAGIAMVLSGYNMVRWRLARAHRARVDASQELRRSIHRGHHAEPRNPDFDFSDPKPEGDDDSAGPRPGSG